MLVNRWIEYAARQEQLPPMYNKRPVPWIIDLSSHGQFIGISSTSSGQKRDKGKEFPVPDTGTRTVSVKPNLLVDKAEYVLGLTDAKDPTKLERNRARAQVYQQAFINLAQECADQTKVASVIAVSKFYKNQLFKLASLPTEMNSADWIQFRVDGRFPTDEALVQGFWARKFGLDSDEHDTTEAAETMRPCIACGEICRPLQVHPSKIKLPGGQASGVALISANSTAYESYGLARSLIAPMCHSCAESYAKGANALIQGSETHFRIGPLTYLFWSKKEMPFSILELFNNPSPEQISRLFTSIYSGSNRQSHNSPDFFAAALSPSNARLIVRDWLETTLTEVSGNLTKWFASQRLQTLDGNLDRTLGIYALGSSLYRDVNREMTASVPEALIKTALFARPLPLSLLHRAVQRNRAERTITHARAVLIKMCLLQANYGEGDTLMSLDKGNTSPAYVCGRLFAVLESVQRGVMPNSNTTIVDRYYGIASTAPASIFGHLIKGAQNHLAKLRKNRVGAYLALQARLEEVLIHINEYPRTLSLQEQGVFSIGYYHQKAADRESIRNSRIKDGVDQEQGGDIDE